MAEGLSLRKEHIGIRRPGVWGWRDPGEGEDLGGTVLQRLIDHHAWEIVMLRVRYREWDAYPFGPSQPWTIRHTGTLTGNAGQTWDYHRDRISCVVETRIPPRHIQVLCKFNILRYIQDQARTGDGSDSSLSIPVPLARLMEKEDA